MVSQGVSVINHSVGWLFDGPGDGTSPSSVSPLHTVDRAVENGAIWVNSAGNYGRTTWFGGYSDLDGDGVLSFGGENDEIINTSVRACRTHGVQLRWGDVWEGAGTDLDIFLYDQYTGETVRSSQDEQSGGSGHDPFETLSYQFPFNSNDFGLYVHHTNGPPPAWIQILVWATSPTWRSCGSTAMG